MGIEERVAEAEKTDWLTEGMSESEVKSLVELAKISARIERCRLDMGMTQMEFAQYMGVTQAMVSKWESREYNFSIKTLNDICQKLGISMTINLEKTNPKTNYRIYEEILG
jgi:transcriptional regulator with XRE-family HTH domain